MCGSTMCRHSCTRVKIGHSIESSGIHTESGVGHVVLVPKSNKKVNYCRCADEQANTFHVVKLYVMDEWFADSSLWCMVEIRLRSNFRGLACGEETRASW